MQAIKGQVVRSTTTPSSAIVSRSARSSSGRPAPLAQRTQRSKLVVKAADDRATGQEAGLKDTRDLKEDIIFKPFDEVKSELAAVEKADMNGQPIEDSFARVGYAKDAEYAVNEQINIEYNMSYVYHAMSAYFDRDNVALPGMASYFRDASEEERTHAQELMDFQAVRGGRTKLAHLTAPQANYQHEEKGDALHAMELAPSLERLNFHKLRELHDIADASHDAQMADFVEDMLAEQAKGVKIVADYVAQLRRIGKGHGVFHFDQILADDAASLATPSTSY